MIKRPEQPVISNIFRISARIASKTSCPLCCFTLFWSVIRLLRPELLIYNNPSQLIIILGFERLIEVG